MKFILMIAWLSSYGGHIGITAQEFNNLDACKSAARWTENKSASYRRNFSLSCISKDSGEIHEILGGKNK